MDRRQTGTLAENSACAFLEAQGFTIVTRNFLRRVGELDVVARAGDLLVSPRCARAPATVSAAPPRASRDANNGASPPPPRCSAAPSRAAQLPRAFRRASWSRDGQASNGSNTRSTRETATSALPNRARTFKIAATCEPSTSCSRTTAPGPTRSAPGSGILRQAVAPAVAQLPVDRLRRQPRAGEPDRGPAARRRLRPSQHREHGGAHRPQLPVGHAVRGRHPQGQTCHRGRPLRLQRRAWRRCGARASASPTTGCATCRTCTRSTSTARRACPSEIAGIRPAVRAQRHRAGRQRLPDDDRARCVGARPGAERPRLDLRHRGWLGCAISAPRCAIFARSRAPV